MHACTRWHGWCHVKLLPSWCVLCTPYNCAPCHFMQSHIRKVHACLALTCHLHFWQNDQDLLHATAVTQGWNRYWNKSQHRKLSLDKKILLLLLQGFEPMSFQSQVWCSNHWAIPTQCKMQLPGGNSISIWKETTHFCHPSCLHSPKMVYHNTESWACVSFCLVALVSDANKIPK